MIGRTLSHYRVEAPLGSGGMGAVFRARDEHLERDVAIKVLPADALTDANAQARFRREALALSRLSHPAIATVFDFDRDGDTPFIVMEYVPGKTLHERLAAGPLAFDEATKIGIEIAGALVAAHAAGIVHRDLKPANLMLMPGGTLKVLDFGVSKVFLEASTPDAPRLTRTGIALGTLAYMAPEQLMGQPVDARTDVYAFGAVLYEMATGVPPFSAAVETALVYEVMHGTPLPPSRRRGGVPPALERVIQRCLERDPDRRFASATALKSALEEALRPDQPSVSHAREIRSVAVLPLENTSRDPSQEYFADGMTEALIADLAQIRALRVISRTSAMRYKGIQKPLPEIARELDVDAVIEGSALLLGDQVRITVRLVDANTDRSLWAEKYERSLENILALQSDVARTIATEIHVHVSTKEASRLARRRAVHPAAHMAYLKGRHQWLGRTPEGVDASLRFYNEALALDPDFALAWAGIADSEATRATRGQEDPRTAGNRAIAAARRALALDESLADAHAALGEVCWRIEWDWTSAGKHFERALELNPGHAMTLHWYAHLLLCLERQTEAQEHLLRAIEIDPLSMILHTSVGDAFFYARDYERALVYYHRAIELDPQFDGAHTDLARTYELMGRYEEAEAAYTEGARLAKSLAGPRFGMAHLYAVSGRADQARELMATMIREREEGGIVSAWGIASLHACLGETEEAFRWLETAVKERAAGLAYARVHPRIDVLRSDPRFDGILKRIGHTLTS